MLPAHIVLDYASLLSNQRSASSSSTSCSWLDWPTNKPETQNGLASLAHSLAARAEIINSRAGLWRLRCVYDRRQSIYWRSINWPPTGRAIFSPLPIAVVQLRLLRSDRRTNRACLESCSLRSNEPAGRPALPVGNLNHQESAQQITALFGGKPASWKQEAKIRRSRSLLLIFLLSSAAIINSTCSLASSASRLLLSIYARCCLSHFRLANIAGHHRRRPAEEFFSE